MYSEGECRFNHILFDILQSKKRNTGNHKNSITTATYLPPSVSHSPDTDKATLKVLFINCLDDPFHFPADRHETKVAYASEWKRFPLGRSKGYSGSVRHIFGEHLLNRTQRKKLWCFSPTISGCKLSVLSQHFSKHAYRKLSGSDTQESKWAHGCCNTRVV